MTAIFTVPPEEPFLERLAKSILNGDLPSRGSTRPDPLALPEVTVLLPTRRAARVLQDAFLKVSGARALLMPQIRPISEGEEDLTLLTGLAGLTTLGAGALDLPPAISALERTLTLMLFVSQWRQSMGEGDPDRAGISSNTPAQAAALASDLGRLMDVVETEGVALTDLRKLVPEAYAAHWETTVQFLDIVTQVWPGYLQARGCVSPAGRRNALITAEAERLTAVPPKGPVIVAGVTGSIPATVTLMRAVLALERGAIVLPALDLELDDASWQAIAESPEHPQFGLKKLLDGLGASRCDIKVLPGARATKVLSQRTRLVSEAMRPSATTESWHTYAATADKAAVASALEHVSLIEAPNAFDEAEAVALILREAVEMPGRTAALVSPDRLLARRVAVRLQSWGIRVDDSAGRPFAKTVPGAFLNLVIDAAANDFAPAKVMALLKHPLCRLGLEPFDVRRFARALELAAFRTHYLGRGLEGISAALDRAERLKLGRERQSRAVRNLWDEDWAGARQLVDRLTAAFAPLTAVYGGGAKRSLRDFATAHIAAAEQLAAVPPVKGAREAPTNPLWQGEAGEAANTFFVGLLDTAMPAPDLNAAEYADLYRTLLARENVRERTPVHPRVAIWGPFESRLQQVDILVLGSLNEGTWPETADPGAWLNRPMRRELGLPSPEEDIGRLAHDFVSLMGAGRVYLTRAEKIKGVPTVASRWLMRLTALLDGMKMTPALKADRSWISWARARDYVDDAKRIRLMPPEPRPASGLRPRKLSVTRIEQWIRNPYAIYAAHILELEPLPALGQPPDQSLRGALLHEVVSTFAEKYPATLPQNPLQELEAIARSVLQQYTGHPRIAAFWLPRLQRFLEWFAATEPQRRSQTRRVSAETTGALVLAAAGGPFTLTARADRVDDTTAGLIITDYKSGQVPPNKAVLEGRAPQLPLEAAIALGTSGFPAMSGRPVASLRYIRASGGEPPGQETVVDCDDVSALAERASKGLEALIPRFDNPATPYRAVRRAGFKYDYDDFADLARVGEWSAYVDEEEA